MEFFFFSEILFSAAKTSKSIAIAIDNVSRPKIDDNEHDAQR